MAGLARAASHSRKNCRSSARRCVTSLRSSASRLVSSGCALSRAYASWSRRMSRLSGARVAAAAGVAADVGPRAAAARGHWLCTAWLAASRNTGGDGSTAAAVPGVSMHLEEQDKRRGSRRRKK